MNTAVILTVSDCIQVSEWAAKAYPETPLKLTIRRVRARGQHVLRRQVAEVLAIQQHNSRYVRWQISRDGTEIRVTDRVAKRTYTATEMTMGLQWVWQIIEREQSVRPITLKSMEACRHETCNKDPA